MKNIIVKLFYLILNNKKKWIVPVLFLLIAIILINIFLSDEVFKPFGYTIF